VLKYGLLTIEADTDRELNELFFDLWFLFKFLKKLFSIYSHFV
jgi:hypothetical protein